MNNNIVLIGFMGSGKTTNGIQLSYRLKRTFLDTDKYIEQMEKKKITEIFAEHGEEYFRDLEHETIKEMAENFHDRVIAVGGGTPVFERNQPLVKELGYVIYLRAHSETIYARLRYDNTRPLLQGDDPRKKIDDLLAYRDPIYMQLADYVLDVDGYSIMEATNKIVEVVKGLQNNRTIPASSGAKTKSGKKGRSNYHWTVAKKQLK